MSMRSRQKGPSHRIVATLMMALTGVFLFAALLAEDVLALDAEQRAAVPWLLAARYVLAMAAGGALSGWLLSGLFGRRGVAGWILALLGGTVASLVAGLLGSAVGLLPDLIADGWDMGDLIAIGSGALVLPLSLAGQTLLFLIWLALLLATHVLTRQRRQIRRMA